MDRGSRGWRVMAGAVLAWAVAMLVPISAAAVDSDLKHSFAFKVPASNGYSILAVAMNERADGRGEIVLFVSRANEGAIYSAPALLTATSVQADLGSLGRVSLNVIPSGKKKTLRSSCGEEPERVSFEPQYYRGIFEFFGEEGYTDALSEAPREYTRVFSNFICASTEGGEALGPDLPGARLRIQGGKGHDQVDLRIFENRPGARVFFEAESSEKRGWIEIQRFISGRVPSDAFDYDPLLRSATLHLPAPFSGHASFHRNAPPAHRWSGDLTVDLPGHSNIPLVVPGTRTTLIHARRENSRPH